MFVFFYSSVVCLFTTVCFFSNFYFSSKLGSKVGGITVSADYVTLIIGGHLFQTKTTGKHLNFEVSVARVRSFLAKSLGFSSCVKDLLT